MKTQATTFLILLSVIPLVFLAKTREPLLLIPHRLRLLAKPEPPPTDIGDQPDQPLMAVSLTLISSLLLLTTTHCTEDDEIRREAEGQKPHLKKEKKTLGLILVRPGHGLTGFYQVVASSGLLTNLNQSKSRVNPPGRFEFNNYGLDDSFDVECLTNIFIDKN